MTHRPNPTDLYLIEIEARRLRAEAVHDMFAALLRGLSGLFARRGAGRTA